MHPRTVATILTVGSDELELPSAFSVIRLTLLTAHVDFMGGRTMHRTWLACLPVLFAVFILLTPFRVNAQAASFSISEIRSLVEAATLRTSVRQKVLIDPRIVDQLTASAILYAENFCGIATENCAGKLRDTDSLVMHIDAFIAEASRLDVYATRSLGDRLADGRLALAGWPSNVQVDYGRVDIPHELQEHVYAVRLSSGSTPLGQGGTAILLLPGILDIVAQKGGDVRSFRATVQARGVTSLRALGIATTETSPSALRPQPALFCNVTGPSYGGVFSLFNGGRNTILESPEDRRANEAPHLNQPGISIDIRNESAIRCDSVCQRAFSVLFAETVAAWRSGCGRCNANALAVLSAYDITWIDWRIGRRLRAISSGSATSLDLAIPQVGESEIVIASPLGGTSSGIHHYVNASDDPSIRSAICKLNQNEATWVAAAQSRLCGKPLTVPEALRPVVVLRQSGTECGEKAIACALPGTKVEVNFRDYR